MRKVEKIVTIQILDYEELSVIEKTLLGLACQVRLNAQAPYSHNWVGCALITADKKVFTGCNIERASWTQTDHAEQVAISSAIAQLGTQRIAGMATIGAPEGQEVTWPSPHKNPSLIKSVSDVCPACGSCLQIIVENCFDENGKFDPTVPLLGYKYKNGEIYRTTIGDAYPMPFLPQRLGINYAEIIRKRESSH